MTEESGGDRIGSLSVDIIADTSPLEGAKSRVSDILGTFPTEVRIKVDASELRNVQAAARAVQSALAAVHKTAADTPANAATKLKFTVDTAKIRSDIDAVLKEPFKIKLEIGNIEEIRRQIGEAVPITVQHHGGAPGGVFHTATPQQEQQQHAPPRAAASSAVRGEIENNPDLRKAIHQLYNDLDRHLQIAGKGSIGPATDDATVKFGRMVDRFGGHLDDFITVNEKGRTTGGALSKASLTAQGIAAPDASSLAAVAKDFQRLARSTQLFSHAREAPEATVSPVVRTALHQAEATARTSTSAVEAMLTRAAGKGEARTTGFDTSTLLGRMQAAASGNGPLFSGPPGAKVLQNDLSDTLRHFVEVTQSESRRSTAAARGRSTGATTAFEAGSSQFGGGTAAPEPEQEAASARLQPNRQLVGRLTFQQGGTVRDMSGLARAAQSGVFSRLGRETGAGKRLVELSTEDLAAFDKITAAGRTVSGRRATIGGREIEKVNPFDEFVKQAEALYGPEARQAIEERSSTGATTRQKINAYLSAGSRLALPNSGIEYSGTGQTGRNTVYGSGLGRAGSGFSGMTVDAANMERLRENVMAAQRASNPAYMTAHDAAQRLHGAASRASIEAGTGLSAKEYETHATEVGVSGQRLSPAEIQHAVRVRRKIESAELPHPEAFVREIQRRVQAQTQGSEFSGDRTSQRAVREAWTGMVGELNQHLGLGLNMQTSPSRLRKQLSNMGLDVINAAQSTAYGEISTGELYANQDINRMRQEGGGDRLGERATSTKWTQDQGAQPTKVYLPGAPLTPAQKRASEMRRSRSERFEAFQQNILHAAPIPAGATTHTQGTTVGERSTALSDAERQYVAQQVQEQAAAYAADSAAIQAELGKTRQALDYISKQSGYGYEEIAATGTGPRANVGGQMRPVYGGRKIRAVEHREEPFFKLVPPNQEGYAKQADVLRARLKKLTAGGATLTPANTQEAQDVQRQLEQAITRSRMTATGADRPEILAGLGESGLPEDVQTEVKSFFNKRTLRGLGQPARRGAAQGATSAQMRERYLSTAGPWMAGTAGETPPVSPYSFKGPIASYGATASPIGGGGGTHGPSLTGGGRGGSGSVIDVNIVQSIPLSFAGGGGGTTSAGGSSGVGGTGLPFARSMYPQSSVVPGQAGPVGGRKARGIPTGPTPATPGTPGTPVDRHISDIPASEIQKISFLASQKTAPLPESMRIRPVIKTDARSQRLYEKMLKDAAAPAAGGRRTPISNTRLAELGYITEEGTVPSRLTVGLDPRVAQARAAVQIARGTLPSRSIGTSFVQLTENLFGGRAGPLARLATLQNRASDLEGLSTRQIGLDAFRSNVGSAAISARAAARTPGATADTVQAAKQLRTSFLDASKAVHENRNELLKATTDVAQMSKSVVSATDVVRNLAAGAVGGVVGGLAAGAVSAVGQAAIQGAAAALGPLIEKMTGFQGTTSRVTGALSDAARAADGNVKSVVANAAATAGLSKANYDALSPAIQQRVAIEAGNKNLSDQVDLLRTAQNVQRGGQSGPLGFLQPGGGIPGLSRSTGGFLGSDIGGTPSTLETITGQLPGRDSISQALPFFSAVANNALGGLPNILSSGSSQGELNSPQGQDTLKFFNSQLEKAGSSLKLLSSATDDQIAASDVALKAAGATQDQIDQFNRDRLAIVGPNNAPIAADQGTQFLQDLNRGAQLPNPEVLLAGMQRQITATVDQINRDLAQSLQNNQANTAVGVLAQPIAPLGRGLLAPNTPANVRATIQNAQSGYDAATGQILGRADQGTSILDKLHVPPEVRQQLADVGAQIDKIAGDMATRQATNFWVDYNHNVDLAKRNVADLVGLTGQTSTSVAGVGTVGASRVGGLENQNLNLSRESQKLGFTQAQNQLNFQTAVAGFAAPGLTGEERAARMEQAKREAAISQRQLNIGETVASNQFEITGIVNKRSLDDAKFQLESLPRNLDLQVNIQIDQQQMAALDQVRTGILADIQSYASAGNAFISAMNSTLTSLESQADVYFKTLAGDVEKSFAAAFGNDPFHTGLTPPSASTGSTTGSTGTTGYVGPVPGTPSNANQREDRTDTGGPGNVTPQGNGMIQVNINGGTFTDEQSRQSLIRDVSTAVQTGMDRKASLIGLRSPR